MPTDPREEEVRNLLLADKLGAETVCRYLHCGAQIEHAIICAACSAAEQPRHLREDGHVAACFDPEADADQLCPACRDPVL